jgi:hypothetical protein
MPDHFDDPKNKIVRERLNENLIEISASNASFEKVLRFLADNMGVNICVDWNSLLTVGVEQSTPVTLTLRNVRMGKALQMVLEQGGKGFIGYIIDEAVITVASLEGLSDPKYAVTALSQPSHYSRP